MNSYFSWRFCPLTIQLLKTSRTPKIGRDSVGDWPRSWPFRGWPALEATVESTCGWSRLLVRGRRGEEMSRTGTDFIWFYDWNVGKTICHICHIFAIFFQVTIPKWLVYDCFTHKKDPVEVDLLPTVIDTYGYIWWFPAKSSILVGFCVINHPFTGTPISGNPQPLTPIHDCLIDGIKNYLFHLGAPLSDSENDRGASNQSSV